MANAATVTIRNRPGEYQTLGEFRVEMGMLIQQFTDLVRHLTDCTNRAATFMRGITGERETNPAKPKSHISKAGRKKIAEAAKERWAKQKTQAAGQGQGGGEGGGEGKAEPKASKRKPKAAAATA